MIEIEIEIEEYVIEYLIGINQRYITPAIVPYSPASYRPVNKQVTLKLSTDL